jgi:ferric-dicitrate binding protein FerR (iron transport regulator)
MPESRNGDPTVEDSAILQFLDGRLDEDAAERMRDRLKSDPALSARMLEMAENEVLIRGALLQRAEAGEFNRLRLRREAYQTVRARVRRRSAIRWLAVTSSAAALLVCVLGWWALYGNGVRRRAGVRVAALRGEVTVRGPGGRAWPAEVGMHVAEGNSEHTGIDGRCALDYADGTELHLSPSTALKVTRDPTSKALRLDAGRMRADVMPQVASAPMRVSTPFAEAVVLGTVFALEVAPDGARLEVERGLVEFVRDRHAELVVTDECAVAPRVGEKLSIFTPTEPIVLRIPDGLATKRPRRAKKPAHKPPSAAARRGAWRGSHSRTSTPPPRRAAPPWKASRVAGVIERVDVRSRSIWVRSGTGRARRFRLPNDARVRVRGSLMGEVLPGDRVLLHMADVDDVREGKVKQAIVVRPTASRTGKVGHMRGEWHQRAGTNVR